MSRASADLARHRRRLNFWLLLIPQQWITLVVIYWLQRLLRPRELVWDLAPAVVVVGAAVACAVPAFLTASWFRPRAFERSLYPWFGLRVFRYLAPDGGWVNSRLRRIDPTWRVVRNAETRDQHLAASVTNERWHLSWLVFGLITQAAAMTRGEVGWSILLTIFNIVFNLYPILHQRHVRARARRQERAT